MSKVTITILENGPAIIDTEGEAIEVKNNGIDTLLVGKAALCRCGRSKKGAFCDGSHKGEVTIINVTPFQ